MSDTTDRSPHRFTFTFSLVLAWTVLTGAVLLAAIKDGDTSWAHLGSWLSLWVSCVLMPTSNALTLHRISRLLPLSQNDDRILRDLVRMPVILVLTANLALISAIVLVIRI